MLLSFLYSFIHLHLGRTEVRRNPRATIHDRKSSDHIHMWREENEGKKAQGYTACNNSFVCQFQRLTSVSVLDHILGVPGFLKATVSPDITLKTSGKPKLKDIAHITSQEAERTMQDQRRLSRRAVENQVFPGWVIDHTGSARKDEAI